MLIFATGIENSNPVIRLPDGRRHRVDEMFSCGHHEAWSTDLDLVVESGASVLRWGPPIHRVWLGPGHFDWDWTDAVMAGMRQRGIEPMLDLLHFGLPDWLGDVIGSPEWPPLFGDYVQAVAARYPWVRYWTPVNEPMVTAKFSALNGYWNERCLDEASYAHAALAVAWAARLAAACVLREIPDACIVHNEAVEIVEPFDAEPASLDRAVHEQFLCHVPLDLILTHAGPAHDYVRSHCGPGWEDAFTALGLLPAIRHVLGVDFYHRSEWQIDAHGVVTYCGDVLGLAGAIVRTYRRYRMPLWHTETNNIDGQGVIDASDWMTRQVLTLAALRCEGLPVLGFTWFSLTDQIDWDSALREANGHVNPVGLFDLNRQPRMALVTFRALQQRFGFGTGHPLRGTIDISNTTVRPRLVVT
jgi:beta-glucosidase/6-phospho-beta-glucosidase/beta-galactosidase